MRGNASGREDAGCSAAAPRATPIDTRLGWLTPAELAPYLAHNLLTLEHRVESGDYSGAPLSDVLLLDFHHVICGDIVPRLAGWRRINDPADGRATPDHTQVPALVRDYATELDRRAALRTMAPDDRLLETLAYAEGRLLAIRPFTAFNGRTVRVWLREVLRRLDLPPVQLAPLDSATRSEYLAALRAGDRADWRPLMALWVRRFETVPL